MEGFFCKNALKINKKSPQNYKFFRKALNLEIKCLKKYNFVFHQKFLDWIKNLILYIFIHKFLNFMKRIRGHLIKIKFRPTSLKNKVVNPTFTFQILVLRPNKLRMICLPNLSLIYHFFHENRVDLMFTFGRELFPPLSHRHLYPCFRTQVPISLYPYNS